MSSQFVAEHDEDELRTLDLSYLRRLWPYVRPYRAGFAICLLILAASFVLEVLGPYLLRLALDGPVAQALRGGAPPDPSTVWWLGLGYLAITAAGVGLGYAFAMLTTRNGQQVIRDVRVQLFAHILHLGPRFFERNPAGKLVTRVTSDVENLNELIATGVLQGLFDLLKIAGILAVLFWVDLRLALVTVLATPAVMAISLGFRKYVRESYRRVRGALARQNAYTAEMIGGMRVTKLFGREAAVHARYAARNAETRDAWLSTVLHFAAFVALVDGALAGTQVAILGLGGAFVLGGTLSAGAFVQFWMLFNKLTDPIHELGEKYNVLQSAFSSSERIFQILDAVPAPAAPAAPRPTARAPAQVRFARVSFAYRPGLPVLHDVDFEVRPGQKLALVGPTGAGKSTVLALVSRLDDPASGTVYLDGLPLPELDLIALRRRIAVVPQDVFLFTGTVLDNVRLFDESVREDAVWTALEAVGARSFVEGLPGGLHAAVEERGATFSHGQRQLLSFARALVTEPDLLVLDEATASIDSESEALIQRGLARLLRGRTAIVVAHRLSTVRDADQILVLQEGRVVERGTHAELLARHGVYAGMVQRA